MSLLFPRALQAILRYEITNQERPADLVRSVGSCDGRPFGRDGPTPQFLMTRPQDPDGNSPMKLMHLLRGALLTTALAGTVEAQTIDSKRIVTGLERPIYLTSAPGDDDRLFIVEKRGRFASSASPRTTSVRRTS